MPFFRFVWLSLFVGSTVVATAQGTPHVRWQFAIQSLKHHQARLSVTARIDRGWHLYSLTVAEGGPMPTTFHFDEQSGCRLKGRLKEMGKVINTYDSTFLMPVSWFEERVVFEQLLKAKGAATVSGEIEFMVCSTDTCIPSRIKFSQLIPVK